MRELAADDERIRFFDHPKDASNGERYRHEALADARGEIVCYLGDDDLWFPEHVETMRGLLAEADFAHAPPLAIAPDGRLEHKTIDLALPVFRRGMAARLRSWIPISNAAHTLAAYRALPSGWTTSPPGSPSDLVMWSKFLAEPGVRAVSGTRPTVLFFPSILRRGWTADEREAELAVWAERARDPAWRAEFVLEVLDDAVRLSARTRIGRAQSLVARSSLAARAARALGL